MNRKKYIIPGVLLAALLAAACDTVEPGPAPEPEPLKVEKSFEALIPASRVLLDSGLNALWEDTDEISVEGNRFVLTSGDASSAVFTGTVSVERTNYLAVLPYDAGLSFVENERVSGTFPATQTARENGCPYPLAYAVSEGASLHFHHLTSLLQFTLADDMTGVQSVTLRGNASEPIGGGFVLDLSGSIPSFTRQSPSSTSLTLNGTLEAGKTYCFNLPALGLSFASGITLEFAFSDGTSGTISNSAPLNIRKGEWTNLSNGIRKSSLTPANKGIASRADWQAFKSALESSSSVDQWSWAGEVVLAADIDGLTDADVIPELTVPLNGKGHTLAFNGTTSLIETLSADVSNLNLTGNIDFGKNSSVGALACVARTGVTISKINSSVNITAGALGATDLLRVGGLVGIADGASGTLAFRNCRVDGTITTLNYAHAVGGIIAHGGGGSAPETFIDKCVFDGSISYTQGACPFDFDDNANADRSAGRIGGLIGDASRVTRIKDSSTGSSCTIDVHLYGMTLGAGGIGGLVGRNTSDVQGYTMSLAFEGTCSNAAAITVHDALASQHNRCGLVLGSQRKAPSGSGTAGGSLTFVDTPAPSTATTGRFSLCQIRGFAKRSKITSLDGTRQSEGKNYMTYLIITSGGKVIVVDGGWGGNDALNLMNQIRFFGGHVDAWFISHPHEDHFATLSAILANPEDITIGTIYHSRASSKGYTAGSAAETFYSRLDSFGGTVVDIRTPGGRYDIDGVGIKVLSVCDEALSSNLNNSSVVLRIWDDVKSVVLLGDCGILEGRKLLATCAGDLDCDFLQIAHHGNKGCEEAFYNTVSFSYALVPTADWIWNADLYYATAPDNLDGGATRRWIENKLPNGHILVSSDYPNEDIWIELSGNIVPAPQGRSVSIGGFTGGESDYFD